VVIEVAIESTDALDFGSGDTTTSHEQVMASNRVRGLGGLSLGEAAGASGVFSFALVRDRPMMAFTSSIVYLGSGGGCASASAVAFAFFSAASFS